jgi:hypothetical protein
MQRLPGSVPELRPTARRLGRRISTTLLALITALTLAPASPAAAAVDEKSPAGRAAGWIAREYDATDSEIELFGTGVLLDALMALASTGTEQDTALDMLDELADEAAGYVGSGDTFNHGAAGKTILALLMYGEDPAVFVDGRDFETELRDTMQAGGDDAGRFGETDIFGQALAVLGLTVTEGGAPPESVAWLASQQCDTGEFSFNGTCPGGDDADTTGLAVLALAAAGDATTVTLSVDWLESLQQADGAVSNGFFGPNANSTALAAQAFVATGEDALGTAAAGYLETLQFDDTASEADAGGLKYAETDTVASTFATIQGVWGLGVPPLDQVEAPSFEFTDTAESVFVNDIEWIAAAGITLGCNPPANDAFCPDQHVTRGQMAAFVRRALELPDGPDAGFVDTVGNTFEADIDAIAAAGITKGCNPPANDEYCPGDYVNRGQMAAFLNRAFGPAVGGDSGFVDIAGNVFETDIEAIAAAGITKGCNPPANDMYCPHEFVTRGQMAAFLRRALSA